MIEWINGNIGIIMASGLVIAVVLLGVIARRLASQKTQIDFDRVISQTLQKVGSAIEHHADVSAVLGLMKQLDADPDAIMLIKSYPETVRAAAWLHYINTLGSSLQVAQRELSVAHDAHAKTGVWKTNIECQQTHVDEVRAKLNAAVVASGQPGSPGLRSI